MLSINAVELMEKRVLRVGGASRGGLNAIFTNNSGVDCGALDAFELCGDLGGCCHRAEAYRKCSERTYLDHCDLG